MTCPEEVGPVTYWVLMFSLGVATLAVVLMCVWEWRDIKAQSRKKDGER